MLPNNITIGISDDGQCVAVQPVHPLLDHVLPHLIPLSELSQRGYEGSARMLGAGVLAALRLVHEDALAPYPALEAPLQDDPTFDAFEKKLRDQANGS